MLIGRVLRSPHAHARILSINTEKAAALPGVKAVVTGSDFPPAPPPVWQAAGETPVNFRDLARNVMARDKTLYDGHAVAAVAATNAMIAEEAMNLIEVDYEVLPHVIDVREAMKEDAPLLHDDLFTDGVSPKPDKPSNIAKRMEFVLGDIEDGFSKADVVVEKEFTTKPVHQGYIEPHACVADTSEDGKIHIHCSSQGQFMVRQFCARVLDVEISNITVVPAEIGGGFGGKVPVYPGYVIAVASSVVIGKPVKWVEDRSENLQADSFARDYHMTVEMAASNEGKMEALRIKKIADHGYTDGSANP